jgi:hypothetical protein
MKRGIDNIAYDIINDWSEDLTKDIPAVVKPFLKAMTQVTFPDDMYGMDSADYIVKLFIMNAESIYNTPNSKKYLDELKDIVEWEDED